MKKPKRYKIYETYVIKVPKFEEEAGFYATAKSSARMSKIHSKNTSAEMKLRKALWKSGCRYRLYSKKLIGKPDIVFVSKRLVVFIDGGFWHGYEWEHKKQKLLSNRDYWIAKIERNMERDLQVTQDLVEDGWTVMRFWEHEIEKNLEDCVSKVLSMFEKP